MFRAFFMADQTSNFKKYKDSNDPAFQSFLLPIKKDPAHFCTRSYYIY